MQAGRLRRVGGASFLALRRRAAQPGDALRPRRAALELGRKDEAKRPPTLAALLPLAASTRRRRISGRLWPATPHRFRAHSRASPRSEALNPKDSFARWALNSIGADPGLAAWLRFGSSAGRCWQRKDLSRIAEVQDGSAQRRRQGYGKRHHSLNPLLSGRRMHRDQRDHRRSRVPKKHSKACDLGVVASPISPDCVDSDFG